MADDQPDPAVVQPSPPGWLPDPYNRHEFRFFDGTNWQRDVLDDGVQAIDNLGPQDIIQIRLDITNYAIGRRNGVSGSLLSSMTINTVMTT